MLHSVLYVASTRLYTSFVFYLRHYKYEVRASISINQ